MTSQVPIPAATIATRIVAYYFYYLSLPHQRFGQPVCTILESEYGYGKMTSRCDKKFYLYLSTGVKFTDNKTLLFWGAVFDKKCISILEG